MVNEILVLEDDHGTAATSARRLYTRGARPLVAHSQEEAAAILKANPDLKDGVCDYNLGNHYSSETIAQLIHRGGQVVLLSATDDRSGGKAELEREFGSRGLFVGKDKWDFETVKTTFSLPDNIVRK